MFIFIIDFYKIYFYFKCSNNCITHFIRLVNYKTSNGDHKVMDVLLVIIGLPPDNGSCLDSRP